jgi:antirestriction protein ArdC
MQNPEATKVAGFNAWKNRFGRFVNPGEKGIQILAPAPFNVIEEHEKRDPDTGFPMRDGKGEIIMEKVEVTIPYFKPVYVFDVEQTDGKPLPTLTSEILGDVKDYEKFLEALKTVSPFDIAFAKIKEDGLCDYGNKKITINEGMSQAQTVLATIHEISHATLHNKDLNKDDLDKPKDTKTKEVEAEAVAYVVCQHYGIETAENSFGYIADWSTGKELPELKNSLETIRGAAHELITKIDSHLFDKELEQKKEQTAEKSETKKSSMRG